MPTAVYPGSPAYFSEQYPAKEVAETTVPPQKLIDFEADFAPLIRQYGLSNSVKAVVDLEEGPGVYEDLRNSAKLNDLEIMQRHLQIEKSDIPIASMRNEGLGRDEITKVFLQNLGLTEIELAKTGIDSQEFLNTFAKGRDLAMTEGVSEGGARSVVAGAPAVAGMIAGAAAGAPFFPPYGAIIGGGAGLILGAVGGSFAEQAVFDDSPILDEGVNAAMESTKVFGEAIIGLSAPYAFKKIGNYALTKQAGFFKTMADSIRLRSFNNTVNPVFQAGVTPRHLEYFEKTDPVMFKYLQDYIGRKRAIASYATEATSATGSSLAVAAAEIGDPGSAITRTAAEIGGAVAISPFNVTGWVPYFAAAKDGLEADAAALASGLTDQSTKELRVGTALREYLLSRGEDPDDMVEQLRNPTFTKLIDEAALAQSQGSVTTFPENRRFDLTDRVLPDEKGNVEGFDRPLARSESEIQAPNSRALTNSATLELIEGQLRALNGRFGADIQTAIDKQAQDINSVISALRITGGKNALHTAAVLRERRFEELVTQRFEHAMNQASLATKNLQLDDPEAVNEASKKIDAIINNMFKAVKAQEQKLYDLVPKNIKVPQTALVAEIQEQMKTNVPEVVNELFPKVARATEAKFSEATKVAALDSRINFLQEFNNAIKPDYTKSIGEGPKWTEEMKTATGLEKYQLEPELRRLKEERAELGEVEELVPPTMEQMKNYRTFLLGQAQVSKAGKTPDLIDHRVYSSLAEAIRVDMNNIEEIQALNSDVISGNDLEALDKARAYGKAMRDVFRRAFPNDLIVQKSSGEKFVDPELVFQQVMKGSDSETKIKLKQLNDAVSFLTDPNTPGGLSGDPLTSAVVEGGLDDLNTAYDLIFRNMVDNPTYIDESGNLKDVAVDRFLRTNEQSLNLIPGLKDDLLNAKKRRTLFLQAQERTKNNTLAKKFFASNFFQNVLGEKPFAAIDTIVKGRNTHRDFREFVKKMRVAATRSETSGVTEQEYKRGLRPVTVNQVDTEIRDAVFESAVNYASATGDAISDMPNFKKMHSYFFEAGGKNPPFVDVLVKTEIMTVAERLRLEKLLLAGEGAQKRITAPGFNAVEEVETGTDILTNLLVRAGGAGVGGKIGKALPGDSTLIANSAGAQAALRLLDAIPVKDTNKILQEAIKDPDYLALLLDRTIVAGEPKTKLGRLLQIFKVKKLNAYFKNALGIPAGQALTQDDFSEEDEQQFRANPFSGGRSLGDDPSFDAIKQSNYPGFGFERKNQSNSAPIGPPQPAAAPPPQAQAAPPQAQAAPPNPQLRQRYAAMYPNDPISGLIEQQAMQTGIGTLPT